MRKKRNFGSFIILLLLIGIIVGIVAIYNLSMFERTAPVITLKGAPFYNAKEPVHVVLDDESGIKSYQVILESSGEVIKQGAFKQTQTHVALEIELPFSAIAKQTSVALKVIATDASKWNFFNGNEAQQHFELTVDRKRPNVNVIANSYAIERGGSAVVVFSASDKHLQSLYIETGSNKQFIAQPFYQQDYYVSLLAWPVKQHDFRAYVVAIDKAGNKTRTYIPLRLKNRVYKRSSIAISDKFLQTTIADLAQMYESAMHSDDALEQFKAINETVRAKNEATIHAITSKIPNQQIDHVTFKPFYPLKNGKKVANFGDHRYYTYDKAPLSESYHLGLDLASIKHGKIVASNPYSVVYAQENGIYGNLLILYHGLGLYTLYGHCSNILVNEGDTGSAGTVVANTGKSGYALGDHLHFGVLVQGVEVRPQEWMDKQWIRLNVTDVIKDAKRLIKRDGNR